LVSGINKHLNILLIKERMIKQFNIDAPVKIIWSYISTKWNIRAAVNNNLIDDNS